MDMLPRDIWPEIARDPATAMAMSLTCKWIADALRGLFVCEKSYAESSEVPANVYMGGRYYSETLNIAVDCIWAGDLVIDGIIYDKLVHDYGAEFIATRRAGVWERIRLDADYAVIEKISGVAFVALSRDVPKIRDFWHILGIRRMYAVISRCDNYVGVDLTEIARELATSAAKTAILDNNNGVFKIIHTNVEHFNIRGKLTVLAEIVW